MRKRECKQLPEPTYEQLRFLEDLWFLWGNNGKKHSMDNHKFIQGILERRDWDNKFFHPDDVLVGVVASILASKCRRNAPAPCEKCGKRTMNEIDTMGRYAAWCGCP